MAAAMSLLRLGLSRGPLCPKRSLWAKWMVATKVPHVPPVRLTANVAPMELMFYFPSDPTVIFQDERNRGIEALPDLLTEIERFGARVLRVDLSSLSAEQRFHEYVKATIPAIHKRYEVKRMFGTARHSACWFGIQVPALLVKETVDAVGDTYPHRKSRNNVVTIHQFLTSAVVALKQGHLMIRRDHQQEGDA